MARRGLARVAELAAVWVGFGLAIGAIAIVAGLLSGRRLSRTPGCFLIESDRLTIHVVVAVAASGATVLTLLYWALGAKRTSVRVAGVLVAILVGAGLWYFVPELVDDFGFGGCT